MAQRRRARGVEHAGRRGRMERIQTIVSHLLQSHCLSRKEETKEDETMREYTDFSVTSKYDARMLAFDGIQTHEVGELYVNPRDTGHFLHAMRKEASYDLPFIICLSRNLFCGGRHNLRQVFFNQGTSKHARPAFLCSPCRPVICSDLNRVFCFRC